MNDLDCDRCGKFFPYIWMVSEPLFLSVCEKKEFICISCFEKGLGRRLQPTDFTNAPCNHGWLYGVDKPVYSRAKTFDDQIHVNFHYYDLIESRLFGEDMLAIDLSKSNMEVNLWRTTVP